VGGYDLLNEPNPGRDVDQSVARLAQFYSRSITAIRAGEKQAGSIAKPIFFEYTVDGQAVAADFNSDPGLVFAPHLYGGSIAPLTVDQNWDYAENLAKGYKTAIWAGEYGWFDDDAEKALPKVQRYGQREDQAMAGGAWWQWRQACGDPHSISKPGGTPAKVIVEYQDNGCPGDKNEGVVPQWHEVVSRPFPQAAPGRLLTLTSDGKGRTLHLTGTGARSNVVLKVWVPGAAKPKASGTGLGPITVSKVPGGWDLTAPATARDYSFTVA
jgi:endoglycosylceramidase